MDKVLPKKFWTKQRIIVITLIVLFSAFVSWQLAFSDKRTKLNVDTEKLTVSEVIEGIFDEYIIIQGVVQPLKTIQLDAIVGGYVTQKLVDGGSMVKDGDIILRLENQQLKLNFLQSETEASRLVNDLQNTRQRLRVERFNLQKTLSDLDFQMAQAMTTQAQAVRVQAQALMDQANRDIAPRFHQQWLPEHTFIEREGKLPEATVKALELKGHVLRERGYIGRVETILVQPNGKLEGAADKRGDDHAMGF